VSEVHKVRGAHVKRVDRENKPCGLKGPLVTMEEWKKHKIYGSYWVGDALRDF